MIHETLPDDPPRPAFPPPDPAAYDTERNAAARARGLSAPYIAGGRDPDQERADREDRHWVRILLIMVVVIVLAGFLLGFVAALAHLDSLVGGSG
ncbi:MAG TPA: hypothetical protein VNM34_10255 [Verrucomicrobiae bacterium]|nr:hypothetical protein [Verrucomicrobiae bacterium]